MDASVVVSTNREPDILKKSKAIPYTMQDKTIIHKPPEGSPYANNPNRNTHASMLMSITCLMPNFFRKKGIARMKRVSDICEIDIISVEYFTTTELANSGIVEKSDKKVSPYILVNCKAPPKNIEKIKNNAIL